MLLQDRSMCFWIEQAIPLSESNHCSSPSNKDCCHYVPINHQKEKSAVSNSSRGSAFQEEKKTKGKIKIYYHLLESLLKINKTNTNKTQQKRPSLSPRQDPCAWMSGWRVSEDEEAEHTAFAYKLCEDCQRRRVRRERIFMCKFQPTPCIIISSAPKKEAPNPDTFFPSSPRTLQDFDQTPPTPLFPQKAPFLRGCLHRGTWGSSSQAMMAIQALGNLF